MSDLSESLSPWAWEGVEFPAAETRVEWGHDSAKHQGYGQRGADVETTGQKPKVLSAKIVLRNGLRWPGSERLFPETYLRLRAAFGRADGFLTHPLYGLFEAHLDTIVEVVDPTKPDGLEIDVTWTEQRGDAEGFDLALATRAAPSEALLSRAAEVDATSAGLAGLAAKKSLALTVGEAFDYLQGETRSYVEAAAVFGEITTELVARLDDPAGASVDGYPRRIALTRALVAVLDYRAQYLGAEDAQVFTVPETMSLARASALAYGDASRASELAAKNRVADPCFVPAGAVLVL